jgi:uncharacterized membrane protein
VHAEHHESATSTDRFLEKLKARLSHPAFAVLLTLAILLWVAAGFLARATSWNWDLPPFPYLQVVLSCLAVFIAILILATQRRADTLASHREQLILQSAFANEQKAAKIIELLEELRRDSPEVRDRIDIEAEQMTERPDPGAVSAALRDSNADAAESAGL